MIQTSSIANLHHMQQNEIWLIVRSIGKAASLLSRPDVRWVPDLPRPKTCSSHICAGKRRHLGTSMFFSSTFRYTMISARIPVPMDRQKQPISAAKELLDSETDSIIETTCHTTGYPPGGNEETEERST